MKRGGGRRYYRPQDLELLRGIHKLLHNAGYTIRGRPRRSCASRASTRSKRWPGEHTSRRRRDPMGRCRSWRRRRGPIPSGNWPDFPHPAPANIAARPQIQSVIAELELCLALAKPPQAAAVPARKTVAKRG